MRDDADRERLRQLLPLLEKSLRHGLATVAFQDADVENLMRRLNAFYREQLGEPADSTELDTAAQAVPPMPASVEAFVIPEATGEEPQPEPPPTETTPETAAEVENEHLQMVKSLKVGTWVEFIGENDSSERAKLSWISPISGKYLFVNRRGLKVADKTAAQLAEELGRGATVVLEELPLFDRALDAIVERLRKNAPTAPPSTAQ